VSFGPINLSPNLQDSVPPFSQSLQFRTTFSSIKTSPKLKSAGLFRTDSFAST
jgi:hypothetical protein